MLVHEEFLSVLSSDQEEGREVTEEIHFFDQCIVLVPSNVLQQTVGVEEYIHGREEEQ